MPAVRIAMPILGCLLGIIGCKPSEQKRASGPGPSMRCSEVRWGDPEEGTGIPGLDSASVWWWSSNDRLLLAVWMDRNNGAGSRGCGSTGNSDDFKGEFNLSYSGGFRDMPALTVQATTTDGTTGSLTVNGETFDLGKGPLLLVSRSSGTVRTKQLNRPGVPVPDKSGSPDVFTKMKSDPEVVAFFAKK